MNIRHERIAEAIRQSASSQIIEYLREYDHEFGITNVIEVHVTPDLSYADIYVTSQYHEEELPKFLSPLAHTIHRDIAKNLEMRKTPKIRFRKKKKTASNTADILTIINQLDKQYGLSE